MHPATQHSAAALPTASASELHPQIFKHIIKIHPMKPSKIKPPKMYPVSSTVLEDEEVELVYFTIDRCLSIFSVSIDVTSTTFTIVEDSTKVVDTVVSRTISALSMDPRLKNSHMFHRFNSFVTGFACPCCTTKNLVLKALFILKQMFSYRIETNRRSANIV